ncbi:PTS system cellobiose-specific IIC component [Bacillus sp. SORGH_AS 510]|uniref:PTS sugar transporter subunit IIC n=1 Tax=Bacillus sp. SORGH_AS_0510 TaxID=3041771 RepID=UPI00278118FC|nr:PTS transporter subunit EIIC [Bacillus sp. SORGH_AS_0510]MDQ1146534.1 PTS system cellobiose-specific IIC component [Bacillus sp. SORGH_AS_0510]
MMNFIDKFIMPFANKLGNNRHLLAIRDALVGMIAITMIGSLAVLLNNLGSVPGIGKYYEKLMVSIFGETWKTLGGDIWWGTLAFMTIFAVFGIAHKLAKSYGDDGFEAMLVAGASFFVLIPQVANVSITPEGGEVVSGGVWGFIGWNYFNATALFTGIIVAIITTEIFVRLAKIKFLVINLPDGVPPAVSRSFAKLLPGMVTIFTVGLFGLILRKFISDGAYLNDWINKVLVSPLTGAVDSMWFAILIVSLVHGFWILGLHGPNILGGITTPLMTKLGQENVNMYAQGVHDLGKYHILSGSFLDAFVYLGGSGATLGLIVAMIIAGRKRNKQIIALGTPPGIFQINEPILFGLPIVLNPLWFIPFILGPIIMTIVAYSAVSLGLVHPVVADIPWVTPAIVGGLLATGGHISGAILAAVNLCISIVIYLPFVIAQGRMDARREMGEVTSKPTDTLNV